MAAPSVTEFVCRNGSLLRSLGGRKKVVRWLLPYGCHHCEDGREVLFDRDYCPIVSRRPGEPAVLADPHEWVRNIVRQKWLYQDATPERTRLKIATAKIVEWGMLAPVMQEIGRILSQQRSLLEAASGWRLSACGPHGYVLESWGSDLDAATAQFAEFRRLLRPSLGPVSALLEAARPRQTEPPIRELAQ
jgi:hypothetical protein